MLRALTPSWRSLAMYLLPRCSSFPVLVQELTQRERLEQAVTGASVTDAPVSSKVHLVDSVDSQSSVEADTTNNHAVDDSSPEVSLQSSGRKGYQKSKKICYQYQKNGSCKYGDRCRFVHSKKSHTNTGQVSVDNGTRNQDSRSFTQGLLCVSDKVGLPGPVLRLHEVSDDGRDLSLCVLLNTGAYFNYVRVDQAKLLELAIEPSSGARVQPADKSVVPVCGQVKFAGFFSESFLLLTPYRQHSLLR